MVRWLFAIFLILHGLVHLLWFVVPWKLTTVEGLPYTTRILGGRIDVGDSGIRLVGLLWVVAMLAFVAGGLGVMFSAVWWPWVVVGATVYSLLLCVLGWPDTRWAILINLAILAVAWWRPF
ncbi:MAG: ABC transporter permease [Chloroflexota bacterium]